MSRILTAGGAQLGPIARADSRAAMARRLIPLLPKNAYYQNRTRPVSTWTKLLLG